MRPVVQVVGADTVVRGVDQAVSVEGPWESVLSEVGADKVGWVGVGLPLGNNVGGNSTVGAWDSSASIVAATGVCVGSVWVAVAIGVGVGTKSAVVATVSVSVEEGRVSLSLGFPLDDLDDIVVSTWNSCAGSIAAAGVGVGVVGVGTVSTIGTISTIGA